MTKIRRIKSCGVFVFTVAATACVLLPRSGDRTASPSPTAFADAVSKHAETLRAANEENIRGDFSGNNVFVSTEFTAEMSHNDDKFVITVRSDADVDTYSIDAVIGSKRVEQYVATENGHKVVLPVVFDLEGRRWMSVRDVEPERKSVTTEKLFADWELECASCHLSITDSTPVDLNTHDVDSNAMLAACGACHAKGLNHQPAAVDRLAANNAESAKLIAAHTELARASSVADSLLAAREYQGILGSVCFVKSKSDGTLPSGERINCLSCHSITNGLIDVATDDKILSMRACTDCHQQFAGRESRAHHTKHDADSTGSNCYNCHMPKVSYGHLRFQRTHRIDSPDGNVTPNACSLCHSDQSADWVKRQLTVLWQ